MKKPRYRIRTKGNVTTVTRVDSLGRKLPVRGPVAKAAGFYKITLPRPPR